MDSAVRELRDLVFRAYNHMAGALNAIDAICNVPGASVDDITRGVKEISEHTRNLLGLEPGELPHPEVST